MKRALSLLLAVVLAFGMASVAFAAGTVSGNKLDTTSSPATINYEYDLNGPTTLPVDDTLDVSISTAAGVDVTADVPATGNTLLTGISGASDDSGKLKVTYTWTTTALATASVGDEFTETIVISDNNTPAVSFNQTIVVKVVNTTPVHGALTGTAGTHTQTVNGVAGASGQMVIDLTTVTGIGATKENSYGNAETFTIGTTANSKSAVTVTAAGVKITEDNKLTIDYTLGAAGSAADEFTVTGTTGGGVLTVTTTGTITSTSGIPSGAKIAGINNNYNWSAWADAYTLVDNDGKTIDELPADAQIRFRLNADMFTWTVGNTTGVTHSGVAGTGDHVFGWPADQNVSTTQLSRGNIDAKLSVSKGSSAIRDISLQGSGNAYVRVRIVEYHVSTSSTDFEMSITLSVKNSRNSNTKTTVSGTVENPEEQVYEDDDYISGEEGIVIKAEDYIRNIDVYGGNGVTATKNLFSGQKYYFVVTMTVDSTDTAMMDKYPTIDAVYKVRAVNMSGSGNFIKIDAGSGFYVYNADGDYIGMSNESLPYSTKYYLSTERITIEGGDGGSDPIEGGAPSEGGEGGDPTPGTTPEPNPNDNPGTGANGLVNVAVMAGVVALAGVAVSMKK